MTGFTPPPRRDLPPEVRDRLRRRLWSELDPPTKSWVRRARAPLAAAIGVALLAAGIVVVGRIAPTPPEAQSATAPQPVSTTTFDATRANAELDRCYTAATSMAKQAAAFAGRPEWKVVFSTELSGVSVTAARVDGRPMFCETTLTSVSLSDPGAAPVYAAESETGALFTSSNGIVAGVIDPSWDSFEIRSVAPNGSSAITEPQKAGGLFIAFTSMTINATTRLHAQEVDPSDSDRPDDDDPMFPLREFPAVPLPAVSIVDNKPATQPDRTSVRGKAFDQCLHATDDPEPDPDSWQPGAAMTVNGSEFIMSVNTKGVSACQWQPAGAPDADVSVNSFRPYLDLARQPQSVDALQIPIMDNTASGVVIVGTVRADATAMAVTVDSNVKLDTDVRSGTFVSIVPNSLVGDSGLLADQHLNSMSTILYDAKGNTLYSGPLHPR